MAGLRQFLLLLLLFSPHYLILFFGQKAFHPIHDHRMVAFLAAIATGVYAIRRLTVATCLACAYAIRGDSIASTGCSRVHHFFILLHMIYKFDSHIIVIAKKLFSMSRLLFYIYII
jgi:hypothetical protein